MSIQVISHTYGPWLAKKRFENGAATYSADLLQDGVPQIIDYLQTHHFNRKVLISTAPLLTLIRDEDKQEQVFDLAIQFLHTYPYDQPFDYLEELVIFYPDTKIILVSAYSAYVSRMWHWIRKAGLSHRIKVVFMPMFIRYESQLRVYLEMIGKYPEHERRIVYFGNLYKAKAPEFHRVRQGLERAGWKLDVISKGQFNRTGPVLSQEEIWRILSRYQYGIGVGRCALEMYGLGLRVLISGQYWGGLLLDHGDLETQRKTNFNGRVITGTRDLHEALDLLPHSLIANAKPGPQAEILSVYTAIDKILGQEKEIPEIGE